MRSSTAASSPLQLSSQLYRRRAERQQSQTEWSSVPRRREVRTSRFKQVSRHNEEIIRSGAGTPANQLLPSWASQYVDSIELTSKCKRFYADKKNFMADIQQMGSGNSGLSDHHGDRGRGSSDVKLTPREKAFDENMKTLRGEMLSLINLDLDLFSVLLEFNEKLEDAKWDRRLMPSASFGSLLSESAATSRHTSCSSDGDDLQDDDVLDDDDVFQDSRHTLMLGGKPLLKAPSPQPPAVEMRADRPPVTSSTRIGTHLGVSGRMYSMRQTAEAQQSSRNHVTRTVARQEATSNNKSITKQKSHEDSEFNSIYHKIRSSIM